MIRVPLVCLPDDPSRILRISAIGGTVTKAFCDQKFDLEIDKREKARREREREKYERAKSRRKDIWGKSDRAVIYI